MCYPREPEATGPAGPSGLMVHEGEYPHGWEKNNHAGVRGPWGSASEPELLTHLIYWLTQCQHKGETMRDPAGNAYYGVDSNVLQQTLESLRRYKRLIAEPLGKQIADIRWGDGQAEQGPKGVR